MGRLIRHAENCVAFPVCPLPVPMIEPTFGTPLVLAVGMSALLAARFRAASGAAIELAAITMRTDPEHCQTSLATAKSLPENYFSMRLHPPTPADFDNGNGSCQGRNQL